MCIAPRAPYRVGGGALLGCSDVSRTDGVLLPLQGARLSAAKTLTARAVAGGVGVKTVSAVEVAPNRRMPHTPPCAAPGWGATTPRGCLLSGYQWYLWMEVP